MYPQETVSRFIGLRSAGLGARRIARELEIPVSTARDWCAGRLPHSPREGFADEPEAAELTRLGERYVYLLGLYLGDGCLAAHPRGVFKLRIVLDTAYPGIIEEAIAAIEHVRVGRANSLLTPKNCVEVYAYSKRWPALFPQHGPGKKHARAIELQAWQEELIRTFPEAFLRGLIHSDGCRFENSGRKGWRAPRYAFDNRSEDILAMFCWACELLEIQWSEAGNRIYVSRKADVARLDEFIGPKR